VFSDIWSAVLGFFEGVLWFFHDLFEPIFGVNSWGWAIIALTLLVRVIILPLAVKQFRSMRAMQALQPQMKELQKKYKVDRELMKKDPEQYRAKKQKLNEEMMALYQREGANPAASCLPLLAQAPIFIALFWTIRGMDELAGAPFYFTTAFISEDASAQGLAALVSETGWPGWLLIVIMSGTMFLTQKQMMARNAATRADDAPNAMQQQQKILLYVMPLFLAVISFQFPLGLLLYWCTTNIWQVAQQGIILREVKAEAESGELADKPGGEALKRFRKRREQAEPEAPEPPRKRSPGASSGRKPSGSASSGRSSDTSTSGSGGDGTRDDAPGRGAKGKPTSKKSSPKDATGGKGRERTGPEAAEQPVEGSNGASANGHGESGSARSKDRDGAGSNGHQQDPGSGTPHKPGHLPRRGGAGRS
jgi:YidC/Oxa1 family membrane protein insertase